MSADDDPREDELRRLQARAYGPDADIMADPAALARLRELEDAGARALARDADLRLPPSPSDVGPRVARDVDLAPSGPADQAPTSPPAAAFVAAVAAHDARPDDGDADASPAIPTPAPPRRPRRAVLAWVAALVAVAIVVAVAASAITAGTVRAAGQPASAQRVATLQMDPHFQTPYSFNDSSVDLVGFDEFHGLTVISGKRWLTESMQPCLLVASTAELYGDTNIISGTTAYGCAAGSFPASALLRVDTNLPRTIRQMFPDGTGLQFVLDGKKVEVYADHAPTAAPSASSRRIPHPTPTPLAIPEKTRDELARGVIDGTTGSANSSNEMSAAPKKDRMYDLQAACTANTRGVALQYEVRTADAAHATLQGGAAPCNGPPTTIVTELVTDQPVQVVFTETDGVREGYAIVTPHADAPGAPTG